MNEASPFPSSRHQSGGSLTTLNSCGGDTRTMVVKTGCLNLCVLQRVLDLADLHQIEKQMLMSTQTFAWTKREPDFMMTCDNITGDNIKTTPQRIRNGISLQR